MSATIIVETPVNPTLAVRLIKQLEGYENASFSVEENGRQTIVRFKGDLSPEDIKKIHSTISKLPVYITPSVDRSASFDVWLDKERHA